MVVPSFVSPYIAAALALFVLVSALVLGRYVWRRSARARPERARVGTRVPSKQLERASARNAPPVFARAPEGALRPLADRQAEDGQRGAFTGPGRPLIALHRPRATRHPILLAHGWFGFDRIGLSAQFEQHYFRGVPARLRALGHLVHVARVSPIGSIRVRAAQLAEQVERIGSRVNIIAHSMGGLDARLAIASHGLAERVASLTTIGTPHHGTPLSDMASALGEWSTVRRSLRAVGVHVDGMYDVSTLCMREFNRVVLDSPDVVYGSVVGAVNLDAGGVHALLATCHRYLLRRVGPNDGVVPATSQLWGEPLDEVDADHWAQVGWFSRFDVQTFYARLAERLAARGL